MVHIRTKVVKESKYLKLIKTETPTSEDFEIREKQDIFGKLIGFPELNVIFETFKTQKEAEKVFNQLDKKYEKFEKGK